MNELEKLCRPLVRRLCEYWCFSKAGATLDLNTVSYRIKNDLADIREKCENDAVLKREFSRIERPLVFFIDYTIKEGHFPFSREWRELARNYNELSGDEKFFDLLSETLEDPDSSERLMMFYLFMGLGFDGCHHNDPEYIERRMKLCATRFPHGFDVNKDKLSDINTNHCSSKTRHHWFFSVYGVLTLLVVFTVAAFIYNYIVFRSITSEYRQAIEKAADDARPLKLRGTAPSMHMTMAPSANGSSQMEVKK